MFDGLLLFFTIIIPLSEMHILKTLLVKESKVYRGSSLFCGENIMKRSTQSVISFLSSFKAIPASRKMKEEICGHLVQKYIY